MVNITLHGYAYGLAVLLLAIQLPILQLIARDGRVNQGWNFGLMPTAIRWWNTSRYERSAQPAPVRHVLLPDSSGRGWIAISDVRSRLSSCSTGVPVGKPPQKIDSRNRSARWWWALVRAVSLSSCFTNMFIRGWPAKNSRCRSRKRQKSAVQVPSHSPRG